MRNFLIVVVLAFLAWKWFSSSNGPDTTGMPQPSPTPADMSYPGTLAAAPKTREGAGSTAEITHEFEAMFDGEQRLEALSRSGNYTVVEVYLDTCAICRQLESTYPAFLQARKDVVIRKVHFPEQGFNFQFSGQTREEVEQQMKQAQGLMNAFAICGTPHIEVYAPDGAILAADRCGDKAGLKYLSDWIRDETGLEAWSGGAFTRTQG
jgi:hypothetical protein